MSSRYSLRPETIERISAAQLSVPTTLTDHIDALKRVIESSEKWRAYLFTSGNLGSARITAVMIGHKRGELRRIEAYL